MTKSELGIEIAELQEMLDKEDFPLALSHNDLIPANIIINEKNGNESILFVNVIFHYSHLKAYLKAGLSLNISVWKQKICTGIARGSSGGLIAVRPRS